MRAGGLPTGRASAAALSPGARRRLLEEATIRIGGMRGRPRTGAACQFLARAAAACGVKDGGAACVIGDPTAAHGVDDQLDDASWAACEAALQDACQNLRLHSLAKSGAKLGGMCYQAREAAELAADSGVKYDAILVIGGRNSDRATSVNGVGSYNQHWWLQTIAETLIPHACAC